MMNIFKRKKIWKTRVMKFESKKKMVEFCSRVFPSGRIELLIVEDNRNNFVPISSNISKNDRKMASAIANMLNKKGFKSS